MCKIIIALTRAPWYKSHEFSISTNGLHLPLVIPNPEYLHIKLLLSKTL